jgi:AraC-like DNA-binding protein
VRVRIAGREEEGMADWLLDTIGDIGAIGFDPAWRPFDLREVAADREPLRQPRGLSARRLKSVLGYIRDHLHAALTLRDLAAVAHLSPYHFARRFKESTGLPPHQYIIARRIERAKQLLRGEEELTLAQVAARVGFWDQGHFTRHFKRLVGATPGRFREPARSAGKAASSSKKPESDPLTIPLPAVTVARSHGHGSSPPRLRRTGRQPSVSVPQPTNQYPAPERVTSRAFAGVSARAGADIFEE